MSAGPVRIEQLFVFIATGNHPDGRVGEGVMAHLDPLQGWIPLVAGDEARLRQLVPIAERVSEASGVPYRLVRFSAREELSIEPYLATPH